MSKKDMRKTKAELVKELEELRGKASLSSPRDLEDIKSDRNEFHLMARKIFDKCRDLTGARSGYVALLNERGDENEVIFLEAGGLPCSVSPDLPMPIRGLRAQAYDQGKVALDNDFMNGEWAKLMPEGHVDLDNVLFAPLNVRGQTRGLIGLANKPGGFSELDARIAAAMGDICASELEKHVIRDELARSEALFREMFHGHSSVKLLIDPETGELVAANEAACKFYGYDEDVFKSMNITQINVLPAREVFERMSAAISGDESRFFFQHRLASGEVRHVDVHSSPVKALGKKLLYSVVHDVTEKKEAERGIRDREETLRALVDASLDKIMLMDLDGTALAVNDAFAKGFGLAVKDVLGRNAFELLPPENRAGREEKVAEVIRSGRPVRFVDKRGAAVLENHINPVFDGEGNVARLAVYGRDITERLEAEQKLRESEAKYRLMADNVSDLIWAMDLELNHTYISPSIEKMSGFTAEEILQMKPADFMTPESLEKVGHLFLREFAKVKEDPESASEPTTFELVYYKKDGNLLPVEVSARFLVDEKGNPTGILGITRDISERKRAEEKVLESERELQLTLDATTDGIWKWNFLTHEMFFSNKYYAMLGYEPGEFEPSYENWADLIHPDDLETTLAVAREYLETKPDFYRNEFRLRTKSGDYRWISAEARVVERDESGGAVRMIGHHRDVTERKQNERALELAAREWSRTFDAIPDSVMIIDNSFNIIRANRAAVRLAGNSPDDVLGRKCFAVLHGSDAPPSFCPHVRAIKDGKSHSEEVYEPKLEGHFIVSASPIFDASGKLDRVVHVMRDVTERKNQENRIRDQHQFMEKVFDAASEGIFVLDQDARYALINRSWEQIFGFARGEYIGKKAGTTIGEEYRDVVAEAFDKAYKGQRERCEFVFKGKGGKEKIIDLGLSPLIWHEEMHVLGMAQDITQKKKAERELKRSQAELSAILHNAPVLVMLVDRERRVLKINGYASDQSGNPPEKLIGLRGGEALRCVHHLDDPGGCGYGEACRECRVRRAVMDTFETGEGRERIECNFSFIKEGDRESSEKTLLVSTALLEVGETEAALVCIEDVTDLKEVEKALRTRLEYEQALGECSKLLLSETADEDPIEDVLSNLLQTTEVDRVYRFENFEDPEKGTCMRQTIEVLAPGVEPAMGRAPMEGLPYKEGFSLWRRELSQGMPIMGPVSSFPLEERRALEPRGILSILVLPIQINGEWEGFVGFDDVTRGRGWSEEDVRLMETAVEMIQSHEERKRARLGLIESENLFRRLFDNVTSGIIMTGPDGKILMINSHALSLLGLDEGIIGKDPAETVPAAAPLFSRLHLGHQNRAEVTLASGDELLLGYTSVEVDLPEGKGLITLFRDIGRLMQAEDRRRRAEQLAQVGELAARLSHEIKNPLASIMAGLQLLDGNLYLRSDDNLVLQTIIEEVKNVSHLVSGILDAARFEVVNPETVDLATLLRDAGDLFFSLSRKKGIDVRVEAETSGLSVFLDRRSFGRAIANLVNNSIEAIFTNGRIDVVSRLLSPAEKGLLFPGFQGEVAEIRVADDGPGIPEHELEKVFSPFYTTKESGTGLGLAVARDVVEFHGGVMRAGNAEGGGAVFQIYLPAGERAVCSDMGICSAEDCDACPTKKCGMTLLCWSNKVEEARLEGFRYPEKCPDCAVFRQGNLSHFYKPRD